MSNRRHRAWSMALSGAALTLFALLIAAIVAPGARAGVYRAAQCNPLIGAGHEDASFSTTSGRYVAAAHCGHGGAGLVVAHEGRATMAGHWGGWVLTAPAGTDLIGAHATVSGRRQAGHIPGVRVGPRRGRTRRMGEAAGPPHRLAWAGAGIDSVTARLRCAAIVQCGEGPDAFVALRRISLTLDDAVSPTIDLGGPLFAPGSRRGDQAIDPIARDKGSGVHRIVVEVNGEPILGRGVSCELAGHVALRLRPCPARSSPSLSAATSAAPFVQGPNEVRVCALDYAPDTTANRACREREVRVDNECPISDVTSGAQLVAAIDGADRARVGPREGATVEGRLLDAQGAGVAGARVCVATRVTLDGRREIVTASPATKPDGSFSVALPAGPSREVRVAYWPDAGGAIERFLTLQARADPRLRLRPRHRLHNGDRVRFGVRIPDPANAGRDVRLKVRSEGRWQVLRSGHTDGDGRWRTGYRFHATTGRRRYAFRAVVPAQNGYPYATGRSAIRHQTVIGG